MEEIKLKHPSIMILSLGMDFMATNQTYHKSYMLVVSPTMAYTHISKITELGDLILLQYNEKEKRKDCIIFHL